MTDTKSSIFFIPIFKQKIRYIYLNSGIFLLFPHSGSMNCCLMSMLVIVYDYFMIIFFLFVLYKYFCCCFYMISFLKWLLLKFIEKLNKNTILPQTRFHLIHIKFCLLKVFFMWNGFVFHFLLNTILYIYYRHDRNIFKLIVLNWCWKIIKFCRV